MMNLDLFAQPILWYLLTGLIIGGLFAYGTGDLIAGLIPVTAFMSFLSYAGYIALWYLFVILLILGFAFAHKIIVPAFVNRGGVSNG